MGRVQMEVVSQRFDHRRARGFVAEGMTCAQLVDAFAPPIDREYVVCLINGVAIPQAWWARVTPKAHAVVVVAITPGKGGGKNPLALIASIAIAVVAPQIAAGLLAGTSYAGAATIGFGITYTQALGTAIGFVGNMLVGMLFKPSAPSISAATSAAGGGGGSPTYSLQGQSNLLDPFGPVRRIFGQHRCYPTVVGRPYVEVYGDDQYMTTLYDIGAGDYDVTDVRIGASHINYFQNAEYVIHRNTAAPSTAWYWGARHGDAYNLQLGTGWTQVDTALDAGYFVLAFAFGNGVAAIDETNGAITQHTVRFQIEWSDYGVNNWQPIEAAYWWASSRPMLGNASAVLNITGGYGMRTGGNPDGPNTEIRGYYQGEAAIVLESTSVAMFAGAHFILNGVKYTTLGDIAVGGATLIGISPPLQTEIITEVRELDGEGHVTGSQYVEPLTVTAYADSGTYYITDSRVRQLALSVTVRPLAAMVAGNRYSIRARQIDGFGDERIVFGDLTLAGVATISASAIAINLRHPHTLMELRVRANDQVSGVLEEISCLATSYLWTYSAGVWTYQLSRSPAWALWEILTGSMNKRPVLASKIDVASFEAWANLCATTHPSTGEARAEFDMVVDFNTTVFALAQTVTAAGRATLTPGDGVLRVVIDEPKVTPVQVFTPHNSKSFKGSRTFVEAPHALRAKFMSRDSWKVEEVVVYNDGYSAANATVFENIELPGVTRPSQVWCDGRYRMAQGIHRQEVWTLEVDLENLICTRGDLVHVAHDVPKLGGLPARIKDVQYTGPLATQWTLTEPLDLQGTPSAFGYTIRSGNGVVHQGQFGTQIDAYTVTPATPVAGIAVGDLHVWGEMAHITYPFLVAAINPQADLAATLSLVPYAGDAIFGADVGTIPPYVPVVDDDLSQIAPPPISAVNVLQRIVYLNRRPLLSVTFDWANYIASTFVAYEVWLTWDLNTTGLWQLLGRTNAPNFQWLMDIDLAAFPNYPGSSFCVKVLGVNAFGGKRTLAETAATCDELLGDTAAPAAPPYFELDLKRDTITLNWEHPNEPDIDFYEVRYDPNIVDASYAQSTIVAPQIAYPTRSMDIPARLGTYFIKTVDTSGNRSIEFASAFTPGDNVWQLNAIATWDDAPTWAGIKDNFMLSGTSLETIAESPGVYPLRAEYYYADLYDGGEIYQTRFTSKIVAAGVALDSIMATWIPLAIADPILGSVALDDGGESSVAELIDVWHEIRWVVVEDVMADWLPLASAIPLGVGEASFGVWRRFQVGDFIGEKFQFRLIAQYIGPDAVPDVGAQIAEAIIEIDMTDRIDGRYDVICPIGGVHVAYNPAFKARPVLSITPDNVVAGDTYTITGADENGFDIEFFNAAASVARQFDWLAKGYGARSAVIIDALVRKGTRKPRQFVTTRLKHQEAA